MNLSDNISIGVGQKAPDFALKTQRGEDWRLSENFGTVIALLFYPKDETLVCTKQMCSLRDHWSEYLETKALIVGISPGTVNEHNSFGERHHLPITLLADIDRSVTQTYAFHWLLPTTFTRSIVIIDAKGFIRTRRVMLRAFRPSDRSVITSIYSARADLFTEKYKSMAKRID
jgi:thioredoxin-dependent peroxiredoxin